jgi:hypothetical protein
MLKFAGKFQLCMNCRKAAIKPRLRISAGWMGHAPVVAVRWMVITTARTKSKILYTSV